MRVRDISDGVADPGLPIDANHEGIKYEDPDIKDHARWQGLQDERESYCILSIQDFGCRDCLHYKVNDSLLENDMAPEWHARHYYQLSQISRQMMFCLRHQGCTHGYNLACDSGGWYRWKNILNEIEDARTTSRWAIEVRNQATQIYQTEYYTDKQLVIRCSVLLHVHLQRRA